MRDSARLTGPVFQEFERMRRFVDGEVDRSIWCHYTYVSLHEAAQKNAKVLARFNRDARFWNGHSESLLCSFLMSLSRIFDTKPDTPHCKAAELCARPSRRAVLESVSRGI